MNVTLVGPIRTPKVQINSRGIWGHDSASVMMILVTT